MGEAKEIIEGSCFENSGVSTIDKLSEVIDDLDQATGVKLEDLENEGPERKAENHFKLGILRASESLVRRAKALLEDYGTDLDYDTDPTCDKNAAGGVDFEGK